MLIEDAMNSDKYVHKTKKKVIPDMKTAIPNGVGVFQWDLSLFPLSKK